MRARLPIFIGGTGLYFKALLRGLANVPPVPAEIREGVRARIERDGVETVHAELARRDPVMGERLKSRDRARVARALEVIEATGRSIDHWHAHGLPPLLSPANVTAVFIAPERTELYARIDQRFAAMLATGALEEVAALASRGLDPDPAGDEGAWRAWPDPTPARRDFAGRGDRHWRHRHPSLRQAAVHLVSPSAGRVRMGGARRSGGKASPRDFPLAERLKPDYLVLCSAGLDLRHPAAINPAQPLGSSQLLMRNKITKLVLILVPWSIARDG